MKKILSIMAAAFVFAGTAVAQQQSQKPDGNAAAEQKARMLEEEKAYYANADTAFYGVRYRFKYKYNKEKNKTFQEDRVLLVGPRGTLDMSYEGIGEDRWRKAHPDGKGYDTSLAYRLTPSYYFHDYKTGRTTETYRIISEEFLLSDKKYDNDWKIGTETKKVGDCDCRNATLDRGGRRWTAWFTTDIEGDGAPYTFNGLPGIVLEISDADNEISWTFNGLVNHVEGDTLFIKYPDRFTDIPVEQFRKILRVFALSNNDYIQKSDVMNKHNGNFPKKYMPSTGLDACDITNPIER